MAPPQCQVCDGAQSKYKCPSCLVPYCSLACFKKHKETPCVKPVPLAEKAETPCVKPVPSEEKADLPAAAPEQYVEKPLQVDEASQVLQKSQLESIAASSEIRDALKNDNLLQLIRNIDSSADADTELEKAMGLEEFRIFTDKVLSTIDPRSSS